MIFNIGTVLPQDDGFQNIIVPMVTWRFLKQEQLSIVGRRRGSGIFSGRNEEIGMLSFPTIVRM